MEIYCLRPLLQVEAVWIIQRWNWQSEKRSNKNNKTPGVSIPDRLRAAGRWDGRGLAHHIAADEILTSRVRIRSLRLKPPEETARWIRVRRLKLRHGEYFWWENLCDASLWSTRHVMECSKVQQVKWNQLVWSSCKKNSHIHNDICNNAKRLGLSAFGQRAQTWSSNCPEILSGCRESVTKCVWWFSSVKNSLWDQFAPLSRQRDRERQVETER